MRPRARHARARRPVRPRAAAEPPPLEVDPRLIEGIALFNHRQFFACHEVLERLWLATDGRPRDFYRGLKSLKKLIPADTFRADNLESSEVGRSANYVARVNGWKQRR